MSPPVAAKGAQLNITEVVVSPMRRAILTAQLAGVLGQCPASVNSAASEMQTGDLQNECVWGVDEFKAWALEQEIDKAIFTPLIIPCQLFHFLYPEIRIFSVHRMNCSVLMGA